MAVRRGTGTAAAREARPRGRDRTHLRPGRGHRVNARFTVEELAVLEAAAAAVGMTRSGYLAEAALAAAAGTRPPALDAEREALAAVQAEMFDVRVAVGRIGTNLNQAVAALHATGAAPDWLVRAVALCERRMQRVDEVIARIDRRLR